LQLRHVSTIGKKLLNSNTSSICPDDMANFYPLAAEIGSGGSMVDIQSATAEIWWGKKKKKQRRRRNLSAKI